MPMSVTYATVNGVLVEENRTGTVTTYVADTLGSVVKTVDEAGATTSGTTYWPYGEVRTSSGSNPSPWRFVGILGYYNDVTARLYIRARTFRADVARWLSVDPLWPKVTAYDYAKQIPTIAVDPSGKLPVAAVLCAAACITAGGCLAGMWIACGELWGEPEFWPCIGDFIASLPPHSQAGCLASVLGCLGCIARGVTKGGTKSCCPPAVKASLTKAKDGACGLPRSCKNAKRMSCEELEARAAAGVACIAARLAIMFTCYGGGDPRHWSEVGRVSDVLNDCIAVIRLRPC